MGLYDNYRLTNSSQIPMFAGSMLPEMKEAKKELDARYDFALGNLTNSGQAIKDAPINPLDAKEYQKVYNTVQEKIAEISKRPDLENIVPATQQLARQTASQLKPFVQSNAAWQSALQKLNDKELGLDSETKAIYMAKMADDYENKKNKFTVNPTTGEIEGGFSADTNFAKYVDLPERVKKYVGDAVAHEYGNEHVDFDGTYIIKNGIRTEELSEEQIAAYIDAGLRTDPEAQAFIGQQSMLKGWQFGKNAKSMYEQLSKPVEYRDKNGKIHTKVNDNKVNIDNLVAQGVPLKEAMQQVMTGAYSDNLVQSMKGLGNKYERNDWIRSEDKSIDPRYLKQMDWDHEDGQDFTIAQGPTVNTNPEIQTAEGLRTAAATENQSVDDYSKKIGDAQLQLSRDANTLTLPQSSKLITDINTWTAAMKASQDKVAQYQQIKEQNLDDAARGLFGKTYSQVVEEDNKKAIETVSNLKQDKIYETTYGRATPVTISKTELLAKLKTGEASIDKNGFDISVNGRSFRINDDGKLVTLGNKGMLKQISDYAEKNYKPQGFVTNTAVIPEKDWKEGILPLLPQMKATDADGNQVELRDKDINWDKVPRSVFNVDGNHIPVTLIDHSGKKVGDFKLDANSTNVRSVLGKKFYEKGSTPEVRNIGEDMLTELPQIVREAFPRNTYSTTASDGKPYELEIDGKPQQVQLMRRADNLFIISDMNGKELKRTASHSQAGRWLRALEGGAQ